MIDIVPVDLDDVTEFAQRRKTMPQILCCMCGISINSNPANMCVNCLRGQVDITDGIPKQVFMHQCRGCLRYLRPPWVTAELESRELLAICLKKITGLSKVKLIDAGFIWTEPHSKRLKVKLTIQKDVLSGVRLQQVFAVEFVLMNQQCEACAKSYTAHTWGAMVQVRQRVEHKKTFFLLEQLILRHGAHERCIGITQLPTGVDFAFAEPQHAVKFIDFLGSVVPIRHRKAVKLIGEDEQNGTSRYKFSYAVEIVPLCKEDLVVLPARTAAALGAISPLVMVQRVSSHVFILDPRSLQMSEMTSERYWMDMHRSLMSAERLEEFTVLDITPVTVAPLTGAALRRKQGGRGSLMGEGSGGSSAGSVAPSTAGGAPAGSTASGRKPRPAALAKLKELADLASVPTGRRGASSRKRTHDEAASTVGAQSTVGGGSRASTARGGFTGAVSLAGGSVTFNGLGGASSVASTVTGGHKGRMLLADAEVMKTRDMGHSDERFIVRTHLGNILRPGDTVLGYDVRHAVYNDDDAEAAATGGRSSTKGTAGRGGRFSWPDIVLVRKVYGRKAQEAAEAAELDAEAAASRMAAADRVRAAAAAADGDESMGAVPLSVSVARKQRLWKLKRLSDAVPTRYEGGAGGEDAEAGGKASGRNKRADRRGASAGGAAGAPSGDRDAADFEAFMRDLESDPNLRRSVNLYKDTAAIEMARAAKDIRVAKAGQGLGGSGSDEAATGSGQGGRRVKFARVSGSGKRGDDDDSDEEEDASDGDDEDGEGGEDGGEIGLEELLDDMALGPAPTAATEAGTTDAIRAAGDAEEGEGSYSYSSGRVVAGTGRDAIPEAAHEDDDEEEGGADSEL